MSGIKMVIAKRKFVYLTPEYYKEYLLAKKKARAFYKNVEEQKFQYRLPIENPILNRVLPLTDLYLEMSEEHEQTEQRIQGSYKISKINRGRPKPLEYDY